MSLWWIGVKGADLTSFEAIESEAKSPEFERTFGVAFGSYRSQEQAEAGIREHADYLIIEAEKELVSRKKAVNIPVKPQEVPIIPSKSVKVGEQTKGESETEEVSAPIGGYEASLMNFLHQLEQLKLQIVRCVESGKVVKEYVREDVKDIN